ncbi:hypothetical protein SADUNF_Sadunf11G0023700 [Salix dunnii]|uniref:Uncharacterized protein n=1 Tax=Salix dunnii TaxID=1413687 RepID=A0A835JL48_9ROSI|nr:hypothetical protein SADUNF_Sadunf11G0023700 [Salix dunnii]
MQPWQIDRSAVCAHVRRGLRAMTPISLVSGSLHGGGYGDGDSRIFQKYSGMAMVRLQITQASNLLTSSEWSFAQLLLGLRSVAPGGEGRTDPDADCLYRKQNGDATLAPPQKFGVDSTQRVHSHRLGLKPKMCSTRFPRG